MKKPLKTESVKYGSNQASDTPYHKAKQEWDNRMGSLVVQMKNWRFAAILSLLTALILLVMLIVSLWMNQDRVFVAQVAKTGEVLNVMQLKTQYEPTQAELEYFLAHFIRLIRSVPLDPVLARKNWVSAYHFLTVRSSVQLNRYFRQKSPLKLLGKKTVTVEITDFNPMTKHTFQVNWIETTINRNGQIQGKKSFSGVFTLKIKQPTTQTKIMENPLGIYIVEFNISQALSKP